MKPVEKSTYTFPISPSDVDFTRKASLSAFLSHVLTTAGLDAAQKGFGLQKLEADDYTWVLSRVALEFTRLPLLEERITIKTWVSDWGRVFTTRNFLIYDEQGVQIAAAVTQWCMLHLLTRSLVNMSDVRVDLLDTDASPIAKARKVNSADLSCVSKHQVVYSDIDFNRHVNTMRYIEMMLDVMPLDRLEAMVSARVDVHFVSECKYGELLQIKYAQEGGVSRFEIAHEDDASSVKASFELRP